jgi:hypothetical protein
MGSPQILRGVPCHHDTGSPQIPYGSEGFRILRVEGKFPNKHSLVGNKGGSPAWGLEESQTFFSEYETEILQTQHRASGIRRILWYDLRYVIQRGDFVVMK